MIYLTYNDAPSGIYSSQVTDVVHYINALSDKKIKLLALISIRGFSENKRKIRSACPGATVLPMFPKARYWKLNIITLSVFFLFHRVEKIIARGPFATNLALKIRKAGFAKQVVFDARGAYEAELTEYSVVNNKAVVDTIHAVEERALVHSDLRIAVSEALVGYWQRNFGYSGNDHVVIPCTLSRLFEFEFPSENALKQLKRDLGYDEQDIIYIYSGSSAGWQSFELVDLHMSRLMAENPLVKLIVLSGHFDQSYTVVKQFGERVRLKWLKPEEVKDHLLIADCGILYREQSVTNEVASPVKFAEYISCGLKVLISDHLGDYTAFTKEHQCMAGTPEKVDYQNKQRIHRLAQAYFYKPVYKAQYLKLIHG